MCYYCQRVSYLLQCHELEFFAILRNRWVYSFTLTLASVLLLLRLTLRTFRLGPLSAPPSAPSFTAPLAADPSFQFSPV